jgi:hypothetical protein
MEVTAAEAWRNKRADCRAASREDDVLPISGMCRMGLSRCD